MEENEVHISSGGLDIQTGEKPKNGTSLILSSFVTWINDAKLESSAALPLDNNEHGIICK